MMKLLAWADLLMYYGILVFCATIPFSIALATGGLFGGAFGWILRSCLARKIAWRASPLDRIIVLFLALQALSILFSTDWVRSLNKFRSYWHLLPFALLLQSDFSDRRVKSVLGILIASGVLSAALGIGQYILGGADAALRISGTFGMYMTYAGLLSMLWALALFQSARPGTTMSGKIRALYFAAVLVIGCALALSMTRIALLAMGTASAILLLLKCPRIFLVMAMIAGLTLAVAGPARQAARALFWGTQTPGMDTNVMIPWAEQRPYLWKGAYRIIKDHPWTGVGLANFRCAYKQYLPYALKKTYNHAHNNFLNIGAETGLPGLAAFIVLNLFAGAFLVRSHFRLAEGMPRALVGGVLGAFAGFHVAGLFEFNFGDSEVAMLFWCLLGLAVVAANTGRKMDANRACS